MLFRRPLLFIVLLFIMLLPNVVFSQQSQITEISAPEVKQMMVQDKPLIVNVLSPMEFELQHIPGSINIPINKLEQTTLLPKDLNRPLVFYCMNAK